MERLEELIMVKSLLLPILSIFLVTACIQEDQSLTTSEGDKTQTILSNYGHLPTVNRYKEANAIFLSTLKKGVTVPVLIKREDKEIVLEVTF